MIRAEVEMVDKFGGFAKLKEILRLLARERIPDALSLAKLLKADAEKPGSRSPFRRPIANDNGETEFPALELDTIISHVKFAEKLELATYRTPEPYLPGMEPSPDEYSEELIDEKIRQFLVRRGITMADLEAAIGYVEFRDIDSVIEALRSTRGPVMSEADFKKCIRLLGDCGVSLRYSRKKTYAVRRG